MGTEYVTRIREIGPRHASEEIEHEHDGYFVKIPECLSGEEEERERGGKEGRKKGSGIAPFAKWSRP